MVFFALLLCKRQQLRSPLPRVQSTAPCGAVFVTDKKSKHRRAVAPSGWSKAHVVASAGVRTTRSLACSFQRSFDPFCPAPKNRHITLQPSNDRITIQFSFPPPYHITPRSPRPPLPRVKRTVPSDPFSALIFCTALKNRHIILQTSNCRIVARRFKTPS